MNNKTDKNSSIQNKNESLMVRVLSSAEVKQVSGGIAVKPSKSKPGGKG